MSSDLEYSSDGEDINGLLEDALVSRVTLGAPLLEYVDDLSSFLASFPTQLPKKTGDPVAAVQPLLQAMRFVPGTRPFQYAAPTRMQVVGPAALRCVLRSAAPSVPSVDVAVEMPASCFDTKDQLNHRYHAKRALYLSQLAARLRLNPSVHSVEWEAGPDPRVPSLCLQPASHADVAGLALRLWGVPPEDAFPPSKLAPEKNNLRQDMMLLRQHAELAEATRKAPALRSAVALLLVWARARSLDVGGDGLSPTFLTHLASLAASKAGAPTTIDLVRAVLVTLSASKKLTNGSGLSLPRGSGAHPAPPPPSAWVGVHDVLLMAAGGWVNAGAGVSRGAAAAGAGAARRALRSLNSGTPEAFAAVFSARTDLLCALGDAWVRVTLPGPADGASTDGAADIDLSASDATPWRAAERAALAVATHALGDRARSVRVVGRSTARDPAGPRAGPASDTALLAARLDPSASLRAIDVGPAADAGEAARAFRAFWGDRAELRRFQDGRIAEAVVWASASTPRHAVVDALLREALPRHLPGSCVQGPAAGGALDGALGGGEAGEAAAARAAVEAGEKLGKQLRALTGPVLRVIATQALGAAARGVALAAPRPHPLAGSGAQGDAAALLPRCLPAQSLLCTLEGSGRWPAAPRPFFAAKAAMACQLAALLTSSYALFAEARADGTIEVLAHGYAFHLILATDRDAAMHAAAAAEAAVEAAAGAEGAQAHPAPPPPSPDQEPSARAVHQGFVGAMSAEHPAFTPSVRLAKAWLAAHLLSNHVCEEAAELLVAAAFGPAGPIEGPPASRLSGFLAFLHVLAEHPWQVSPLAVTPPPAGRGPGPRSPTAPMDLLVMAGDTLTSSPWTRAGPSGPVLRRLVVLAQRARRALHSALVAGEMVGEALVPAVFARDLHECDAVLRLCPTALPGGDRDGVAAEDVAPARRRVLESEVSALRSRTARAVLNGIPYSVISKRGAAAVRRELLVGFDPVQRFVAELESALGSVAVILADYSACGNVVGLKWRTPALQGPTCTVAAAQDLADPARAATAQDRALGALCDAIYIGAGLVQSVEVAGDGGRDDGEAGRPSASPPKRRRKIAA